MMDVHSSAYISTQCMQLFTLQCIDCTLYIDIRYTLYSGFHGNMNSNNVHCTMYNVFDSVYTGQAYVRCALYYITNDQSHVMCNICLTTTYHKVCNIYIYDIYHNVQYKYVDVFRIYIYIFVLRIILDHICIGKPIALYVVYVYTVQYCTLYSIQGYITCPLYIVQCTLYSVQ